MLIKIMTIAFSSAYGGFNDEELFDSVRDKELAQRIAVYFGLFFLFLPFV